MNVAVTQLEYLREDRNQRLDCLDQNLTVFLQNFASSIYQIPNSYTDKASLKRWIKTAQINAIVLSGGGNIGESIARENIERSLLNYAIKHNIPLIGICRGMQAIILHFGGTLAAKTGHVGTRHCMVFNTQQITVNSFHDFCVNDCSSEFNVLARAKDNTIESVSHKKHQILGIMWHPEREEPFQAHDLALFNNFMRGQKL